MLIFICSMPRSGGTLLYQLTKEITEQAGLCQGRGFAREGITSGVVKTEFCEPWMLERVNDGALAFGSYRDFRDIILSLRDFYNRREKIKGIEKTWTITDALNHRPEILDSYHCWRDRAVWFRYERHTAGGMTAFIAGRLGVILDPGQGQAIIDKYSLEANIRRMATQKVPMDAGTGSMLTKWHIGPKSAKWQQALTKAEVKQIERVGGRWLREHGYK